MEFDGFDQFLATYCFTSYLVRTPANLRALIHGVLDALVAEGIVCADHPLLSLLRAGVPITVNTDDPTFFHTTLSRELYHVVEMGGNPDDLLAIIENGFAHAFLPPEDALAYRREVRRRWERHVGALPAPGDAASTP